MHLKVQNGHNKKLYKVLQVSYFEWENGENISIFFCCMNTKQKSLLPSLREKKRYVVFEVYSQEIFSFADIKDAIVDAYRNLFGEIGLAKAGIDFVEFKNSKGILKINNKCLNNVKASFCFARKINKQDVILRSMGVSGMLNKARTKFISGGGL